jgi:hypothetical protein
VALQRIRAEGEHLMIPEGNSHGWRVAFMQIVRDRLDQLLPAPLSHFAIADEIERERLRDFAGRSAPLRVTMMRMRTGTTSNLLRPKFASYLSNITDPR